MKRTFRRILIRTGLVLVVLLVIGLAGFTWFAFWPLEGRVARVIALVPGDVDFVYKTSWRELKAAGWLEDHLLEHPVFPQLGDAVAELETQLLERLQTEERLINAQIPLGLATFSFEEDVVPGEIVAAGRFCEQSGPDRGPPRWREILLLTRVSWKSKFFSALKHGFVRDRVGPGVSVEDRGGGIYRFLLHDVRPSPVQDRSICGPGIVIPPENEWYGLRVKDVLAFSNSEDLLKGVAYLAEFPDSGRGYVDRPWITFEAPRGSIAASMDLQRLEQYLVEALQLSGRPFTIIQRYLTVTALDRMNGHLWAPSPDQLRAHAEVRYHVDELHPGVRDVYALSPEPVRAGIPTLVPARDTFVVFLLRTPPLHLLKGIYEDLLGPADRKLWNDNLRRMGRYATIDEFFREFSEKLGDTAAIAVGRVSETFDEVEYPDFYSDPLQNPDASFAALGTAMIVRLRQGTKPDELDAYLADRIPLLGASKELEKVEYKGFTYTRLHLEQEIADFALVKPAYLLAQDHFIFCSNESYFRKILDTMADPARHPPLASDATFRATADAMSPEAQVALFVDLDKLLAVPPDLSPGAGPRGFMFDRRNLWVIENKDPRQAAIRYRVQRLRALGRQPTLEESDAIERDVDAHVRDHMTRYRQFLEEYRQDLEALGRLRSLGFTVLGRRDALEADVSLLLEPPGGEARAER